MSDAAEFRIMQDGLAVVRTYGPRERAWTEIKHYAAQYAQDGPLVIQEREGRKWRDKVRVNIEAEAAE